jgi:hypothetical protein
VATGVTKGVPRRRENAEGTAEVPSQKHIMGYSSEVRASTPAFVCNPRHPSAHGRNSDGTSCVTVSSNTFCGACYARLLQSGQLHQTGYPGVSGPPKPPVQMFQDESWRVTGKECL